MQATTTSPLQVVSDRDIQGAVHRADQCALCPSRTLCWSADCATAQPFSAQRLAKRRVRRGESLFHMGDAFHSLYTVRSGTFKTTTLLEDGRDQVTGFHISGEILGLDGISVQAYQTDCVALEDSEVCVLPYDYVLGMASREAGALRDFLRMMSQEIAREQCVMASLGTMQADERVAMFLLGLSSKHAERGLSPRSFILRMTREEIGSYLGLKLETVSRVLARFQVAGYIQITNSRQIELKDPVRLRALLTKDAQTQPSSRALSA